MRNLTSGKYYYSSWPQVNIFIVNTFHILHDLMFSKLPQHLHRCSFKLKHTDAHSSVAVCMVTNGRQHPSAARHTQCGQRLACQRNLGLEKWMACTEMLNGSACSDISLEWFHFSCRQIATSLKHMMPFPSLTGLHNSISFCWWFSCLELSTENWISLCPLIHKLTHISMTGWYIPESYLLFFSLIV